MQWPIYEFVHHLIFLTVESGNFVYDADLKLPHWNPTEVGIFSGCSCSLPTGVGH